MRSSCAGLGLPEDPAVRGIPPCVYPDVQDRALGQAGAPTPPCAAQSPGCCSLPHWVSPRAPHPPPRGQPGTPHPWVSPGGVFDPHKSTHTLLHPLLLEPPLGWGVRGGSATSPPIPGTCPRGCSVPQDTARCPPDSSSTARGTQSAEGTPRGGHECPSVHGAAAPAGVTGARGSLSCAVTPLGPSGLWGRGRSPPGAPRTHRLRQQLCPPARAWLWVVRGVPLLGGQETGRKNPALSRQPLGKGTVTALPTRGTVAVGSGCHVPGGAAGGSGRWGWEGGCVTPVLGPLGTQRVPRPQRLEGGSGRTIQPRCPHPHPVTSPRGGCLDLSVQWLGRSILAGRGCCGETGGGEELLPPSRLRLRVTPATRTQPDPPHLHPQPLSSSSSSSATRRCPTRLPRRRPAAPGTCATSASAAALRGQHGWAVGPPPGRRQRGWGGFYPAAGTGSPKGRTRSALGRGFGPCRCTRCRRRRAARPGTACGCPGRAVPTVPPAARRPRRRCRLGPGTAG